jgi:hypothetical protein
MFGKTALQVILGLWVLWHLAFGVLATFDPDTGARITGWSPAGGWTTDMLAMTTQYGMVMMLLALMYAVMAADPLRYIGLLWVAIAEQVLGIAYAIYIYFNIGGVTLPQVAVQGGINVVIIALLFGFWSSLRSRGGTAATA